MKDLRSLLLLVLATALLLYGCAGGDTDRRMDEAEAVMARDPVRAWDCLAEIDTASLSEGQKYRMILLAAFGQVMYANPIRLSEADIAEGDSVFLAKGNVDAVRWLIIKSYDAKYKGNAVARLENLKDAEFLAVQLDRRPELGFIYLYLANVYERGFNGTVSRYYADKAAALFRELGYPHHLRDARMATAGALSAQRDYSAMLDTMLAMQPEVMANATESYKAFFKDQLARTYSETGHTAEAMALWHELYDGREISANSLAHWATTYLSINEADSALTLIERAVAMPLSPSDEYLCRNVQYQILEKLGRKEQLPHIDSLRAAASVKVAEERQLEQSSLSLNMKYDTAARAAWRDAASARQHTGIAVCVAIIFVLCSIIIWMWYRRRQRLMTLQHENDVLRIQALQNNLFESDRRNEGINTRIAELFRSRFKLLDGLAATYFECRDTVQEQKRIYNDVRGALNNFSSPEAVQELTEVLNGYHDNLMEKFRGDFPRLSAAQYRLALYLFCGFSLPSISIFTGTELRNIYVYKSRLKSLIAKSDSPRKAEYLGYFG